LTFANTLSDRDLAVGSDSNMIDSAGDLQRPSSFKLGSALMMDGWATTTVIAEAPVTAVMRFPKPVSSVARLKITMRWTGGEGAVEFRSVSVDKR
jgi:hypothetical protein